MDPSEMKTLEEKTRGIVETLSKLEDEAKRQKDMGDSLEQSKDAIVGLSASLRSTAEKLSDVIELMEKGTLGEDVSRLARLEAAEEAAAARDEELSKRLDALEAIVGRIDRNTQKGIGKERG